MGWKNEREKEITVEHVFGDIKGRRDGLLKAFTAGLYLSVSLSLTFLYFFSVEMLFWALRHCRFRLYNKNLALLSFLSTRFLSLCIYYLALNCKSITSLYNIFVFLDFSRFFHLLFRLKKNLFYCFEFRNRKRFFFVWFFLVLILFFFVWIIVRFCLVSRD